MKKLKMVIAAATMLVLLGACGQQKNNTKESSETNMSTEQSTNQSTNSTSGSGDEVSEASVFTGVLAEDATETESDGSIRITLHEIGAVSDPEEMLPNFQNNGVILNAQEKQLAEGLTVEQLKSGDKIRFTLAELPIMTMSIPPQIPGNSITLIEKVEE
ncbi:hypothetical protein [Candidatus Enterococcus clewellii]|uniref:Lipoprotein n=1 Tax=Candidatus Enterococcus clewellii TaxID=1834193 RepID=A0A242KD90_9ENTE|nr:hypothetical protein [Enterococcus sp. 9E7_DIV0242]OTP19135.1 hypothetical protein A5888_000949 [Enterococcus sp. 9E7_DIV0242]